MNEAFLPALFLLDILLKFLSLENLYLTNLIQNFRCPYYTTLPVCVITNHPNYQLIYIIYPMILWLLFGVSTAKMHDCLCNVMLYYIFDILSKHYCHSTINSTLISLSCITSVNSSIISYSS